MQETSPPKNQDLIRSFPTWAVFGIAVLTTVFASLQVKLNTEHEAVSRFASACDQIVLKIRERLGAHELILRGGAALFAASDAVTRQAWRTYVETLRAEQTVPGLQGIGFAQVIAPAQLASHIARIRAEGFPDYTVRPGGERPLYTSIVYLEPFRDRNLLAFGYDMLSEPVRRAAMERARDSGVAALSGKVVLVQETGLDIQAGTLMYVPVYHRGSPVGSVEDRRAALIGWAYSPYRMKDLMAGIVLDWENQEGEAVELHIYDEMEASEANLLFDSKSRGTPSMHSPFHQQRAIDFHGHAWRLDFDHATKQNEISYSTAWATLIGGLVLSGLVFALMLNMLKTRTNAVREETTKATAEYTRSLIDASLDPLVTISSEGKIMDVNLATERVTGMAREKLIGSDFTSVVSQRFHERRS